jgi:hypothetical protein
MNSRHQTNTDAYGAAYNNNNSPPRKRTRRNNSPPPKRTRRNNSPPPKRTRGNRNNNSRRSTQRTKHNNFTRGSTHSSRYNKYNNYVRSKKYNTSYSSNRSNPYRFNNNIDAKKKKIKKLIEIKITFNPNSLEFNNEINDYEIKLLADELNRIPNLKTLIIRNCNIKGYFLFLAKALEDNHTLTTLVLDNNNLISRDLKYLADALKGPNGNKTLTTLYISNSKIDDDGAIALAGALKTNNTLTTLNIFNNLITDVGAKAFSEALKTNYTLYSLNLSEHDSISEELIDDINTKIDENKKAKIHQDYFTTAELAQGSLNSKLPELPSNIWKQITGNAAAKHFKS